VQPKSLSCAHPAGSSFAGLRLQQTLRPTGGRKPCLFADASAVIQPTAAGIS
jgi:hypothetical protein